VREDGRNKGEFKSLDRPSGASPVISSLGLMA
jgi:hypothetical protein